MRIQPILQQRREQAHAIAFQQGLERERKEVQLRNEMRAILYKVIEGHIRKKRNFRINGEIVTVEEDLPHGTILNAIVLDLRLQAGYNNWNKIIPRFNRIMLQTLPPELRQQAVTNSNVGMVESPGIATNMNDLTVASQIRQQAVTNSPTNLQQSTAPQIPVLIQPQFKTISEISKSGKSVVQTFQQQPVTNSSPTPIRAVISSEAERSVAHGEISRTVAISNTSLPLPPNPGTISTIIKSNKSAVQKIQQQPVTNSPSNTSRIYNSPFEGGHQCKALMGGCVTKKLPCTG